MLTIRTHTDDCVHCVSQHIIFLLTVKENLIINCSSCLELTRPLLALLTLISRLKGSHTSACVCGAKCVFSPVDGEINLILTNLRGTIK